MFFNALAYRRRNTSLLTTATHFSRSIVKRLSRHELAGIRQPIIHSLSSLGKRRRFASLVKLLITEYFILCLLAALSLGMAEEPFPPRKAIKSFRRVLMFVGTNENCTH